MSGKRRGGFNPRSVFGQPQKPDAGVHAALLKNARKSGQLNLSNRSLTEVPSAVWRINLDVPEEAKTVSLDNTEDRWWEQVDLTKLILASNQIAQLSEDIKQLPALTVLDVHDNLLTDLPKSLGTLTDLQKLHLSHNRLCHLPLCVSNLTNLTSLHLAHNQISELGDHIGNLYVLEELDLSNNLLVMLPRSIGYLSKLFRFTVANNKLRELPCEVGGMNSLRMLDCTHNELTSVPEELGQLLYLEQLYLRHNRLTHIPILRDCKALKELHVGNNAIKEITPEHLEHLRNVSVLDLRDNKIAVLPEEITVLAGLERLDLTNNDLSTLPYALGAMNKLKSLMLEGNTMRKIRRDIMMRGTTELKKYLRSRMDEEPDSLPSGTTSGQTIRASQGTSGIIGGVGELDPYTVQSSKCLEYSGKQVAVIPEEVWSVVGDTEISTVNFSKNLLTQWPDRFSVMAGSLQDVNLGFNKLSIISPDVGMLQRLVNLDLRNNLLSDLPKEISQLKMLRELTISFNRFRDIPTCVFSLNSLENLLASDNQIQNVDAAGFIGLSRLATLDLQNNDIMQVPPELGNCTQLRSLLIAGNPFRQPRPAVLAKGTNHLLEYLKGRIPT